jgi:hypothetical protein
MLEETARSRKYVVQFEYLGGQLGNQSWYWNDHHRQSDTLGQAQDQLALLKATHQGAPSKFYRGTYRIVERHTVVSEKVVLKA